MRPIEAHAEYQIWEHRILLEWSVNCPLTKYPVAFNIDRIGGRPHLNGHCTIIDLGSVWLPLLNMDNYKQDTMTEERALLLSFQDLHNKGEALHFTSFMIMKIFCIGYSVQILLVLLDRASSFQSKR